jgi:hypothetical protein
LDALRSEIAAHGIWESHRISQEEKLVTTLAMILGRGDGALLPPVDPLRPLISPIVVALLDIDVGSALDTKVSRLELAIGEIGTIGKR